MIRINDIYDTDDLFDWIYADRIESALRKLNEHYTDDPIEQLILKNRIEDYEENYKIRKYE